MVAQFSGVGRPLQLPVQGIRNMFGGGPGGAAGLAAAQQVRDRLPGGAPTFRAPVPGGSFTGDPVAASPVAGGSFAGDPTGLGILSEAELESIRNIPGYAEAMIRRAKTGGKRDMSGLGDLREGMMGQALKALLAMIMPNNAGTADENYAGAPVAQANDLLAQLVAGSTGGGYGGVLRNQAANLMNEDFSGLKDNQIYQMLAAAQGAAGYGYGDFAQFAPENALAELQNTYQQNALGGGTTNVLGQPGALTAFQELLQQYLGTK